MPQQPQVTEVKIANLKPYPHNYNVHSPEQLNEIAHSLDMFHQFKNIVTWQGFILAGHGLVEAAQKLGWETVEARDMSHLSQEEAEALLVADNETANLASPDYAKLQALIEQAQAAGMAVPGVTAARLQEIVEMAREFNPVGPDKQPRLDRKEPVYCPHCGENIHDEPKG